MNDKFDELAKGMAQSVTRRGALKKFGLGIASIALASLGLVGKAEAGQQCKRDADCANLGLVLPACCGGRCVDLWSNGRNCGACNHHCIKGSTCCYWGSCIPCP